MFTWICPRCGREVPPSYDECPDCAKAAQRGPLPTWLLTIVFALAFVGLVGGVYWLVGAMKGSPAGAAAKQPAATESPAAKPGSSPSPYQKYIEISGIRFLENAKKKPEVRFVVTNHSGAAIDGLSGNVTIWARTRKSEEEAAGTFQFTTNIGAW